MRDYKPVDESRLSMSVESEGTWLARMLLSVAILAGGLMLLLHSCADAVVRTADIQEQFYSMPYSKPAAFRKASPTLAEMEHLEHIRRVNSGKGIGQVAGYQP